MARYVLRFSMDSMEEHLMSDEVNAEVPGNDSSDAPQEQERKFTQADMDRVVEERLARERRKTADYSELKAKVEATKSDAEKAVEAARAEAEAEVTKRFTSRILESEVRSHAAGLKFRDPSDALSVFGSRDGLVSDDGTVNSEAIGKRLSEIATSKPYLIETAPAVAKRPSIKSKGTKSATSEAKPTRAADALAAYAIGR